MVALIQRVEGSVSDATASPLQSCRKPRHAKVVCSDLGYAMGKKGGETHPKFVCVVQS